MNKNDFLQSLEKIGLSKEQSIVYETLVTSGSLSARKLAINTGINRTLIYRITKQLIEMGLIEEHNKDQAIITFSPLHPNALKNLVDKKIAESHESEFAFSESLGHFSSLYNLATHKPGVRFLEGISGIRELTHDIIQTKKEVRMFRSPYDGNTVATHNEAMHLLEARAKAKIHTKLINPTLEPKYMVSPDFDKKYLIDRVRVEKTKYVGNSQMLIYGSKVAFTSFHPNNQITFIIEDKLIAETQAAMFDTLFEILKEHDLLSPNWEKHTAGARIDDTSQIRGAYRHKQT